MEIPYAEEEFIEEDVRAEDSTLMLKRFVSSQDLEERVAEALTIIEQYGGIDGGHHKTWVIDQVLKKLTGDSYRNFVEFLAFGGNLKPEDSEEKRKRFERIAAGDYYEDDYTDEEVEEVENCFYGYSHGIAP